MSRFFNFHESNSTNHQNSFQSLRVYTKHNNINPNPTSGERC